jgi:hypothetical protein
MYIYIYICVLQEAAAIRAGLQAIIVSCSADNRMAMIKIDRGIPFKQDILRYSINFYHIILKPFIEIESP